MWFTFSVLQGAYTGVCSQQHVPSYKNNIEKFRAQKVDSVICVAVNDPYVMNAWAEKLEAINAVSLPWFYFVKMAILSLLFPLIE